MKKKTFGMFLLENYSIALTIFGFCGLMKCVGKQKEKCKDITTYSTISVIALVYEVHTASDKFFPGILQ